MKDLGLDFIRRVMAASAMVAMLAFLFVSVYYDWRFGLGIFIGTAWGIANFYFLTELVVAVFTPYQEIDRKKVVLLVLAKFPALYGAGFLVLYYSKLPVPAVLIGFHVLFAVAVLKVLGRLLNERLAKADQSRNINPTVR